MLSSPLLKELIDALCCLPGVGPKSAQRMAFQLLERKRDSGVKLAQILAKSMELIGHCTRCRTFCESDLCETCLNPQRDNTLLCIVESPADIPALEQTGGYRGLYFVLMGHLSPLDGIGPQDIGIDLLEQRLSNEFFAEIILATNPTVEGEATAHYIANLAKEHDTNTSRIAHGVPLGGELDMLDSGTLAMALSSRSSYHD